MNTPLCNAFAASCLLLSSHLIAAQSNQYTIDVWADNWFSATLNGEPFLEDSVSITTERSFNAESLTFSAQLPFVLAFTIKDFKENDTGLEYIGSRRQQMGDGGFITQIVDQHSQRLMAVSDEGMRCQVIHKAPLNSACVDVSNPVAGQGVCQFKVSAIPNNWQSVDFDDSAWPMATEYSESAVRPKFGYNEIDWAKSAKLIWTEDLEKDNTLICRLTVKG